MSQGAILNTGSTSLSLGPNSLLIVSALTNPYTKFGTFASQGIVHTVGTALAVAAGQGFGGSGSINDPVNCQGMIAAINGPINLTGGLTLSGTASVNLNASNLTTTAGTVMTQDLTSGLTGASLVTGYQYVGNTAAGVFTQSGGINSITNNLYLGYNLAASGSYSLGSGGALSAGNQYVGYSGSGSFVHSGGSNSISNALYLGYNAGSSGSYAFNGDALSAGSQFVGFSGSGSFTQSTGVNSVGSLYLGYNSQSSGSYNLNGGRLSANSQTVGGSGSGIFLLSNGTDSIGGPLYLGAGGSGVYTLSSSCLLTAGSEYIGAGGTALFQQSGGTNSAGFLSIGSGGRYLLAGGSLALTGYVSSGTLDGGNNPATISFAGGAIYDISQQGTFVNTASASISLGPNSLLIVSPSMSFGSYGATGIVHVAGTTLVVPAEQGFAGNGSLADPINCQGTITASGGPLLIANGLTLSGSGYVNLDPSSGTIMTQDNFSSMSGGTLVAAFHFVAYTGSGTFTQSGGANMPGYFDVGYLARSQGTYVLNGGALQTMYDEYVGRSGTGTFTQSAGTNSSGNSSNLFIGMFSGGNGTYNLGGGSLSSNAQWVGYYGNGSFIQSGGSNSSTGSLTVTSAQSHRQRRL